MIIQGINKSIENQESELTITRKVYLHYQSQIFKDDPDTEFYIKNQIAQNFDVPFRDINVVGSTKTGFSFVKETNFKPGESDLDIAVICTPLYSRFLKAAHIGTKGFTDQTPFPFYKGKNVKDQFVRNLKHGYINPFFMPECEMRTEWLEFFLKLGNEYFELFKSINGGIYFDEYFFEYKQKYNIELFIDNPKKYDKISG